MSHDWAAVAADEVIARNPDGVIVCASGISPSGPIHLGNLREIMVPHLVAEEIRSRGRECDHLLSWDDYDPLRRIPAGVPARFADYIGRPLTAIPDPYGELASWAERFKTPFRSALAALGVTVREISQTHLYQSGAYAELIDRAIAHREHIAEILGRPGYVPYRDGKLAWKVDWPMRWAYEHVDFEAAGVDHSSPGSSFAIGTRIVREVFGAEPPVYRPYSFVGTRGAAKMSGSMGNAPTPADALRFIEPAILRWLYERRRPQQAITIDFGTEIFRLYDEWDRLCGTERPSFRLLASIVDITAGDDAQIRRILDGAETAPRLALARNWVAEQLPEQDRTRVRTLPDAVMLAALDVAQRAALDLLLDRMGDDWSLAGLTRLAYGVPKLLHGHALDDPPTPEIAAAQKDFFRLLYRLLLGAEQGPRIPTLLLAVGRSRLCVLLSTPSAE